MNNLNHIKSLLFILTIVWANIAAGQTNLNFHSDETGVNVIHTAEQEIKLLPGYNYTPSSDIINHHSYIDENNIFNTIYDGLPEDNFIERELNTSLPVGSITGSHSVNLDGSASYVIPMSLPPGTNSLIPSLALSYNSNGGSGLLGMGWGISGISRISKKPQAFRYASYLGVQPIGSEDNYTYDLDGRHFGKNVTNSTWSFEEDNYDKISPYNGGFKVETKNGLTYFYGTDALSREDDIYWNIDRIEDQYGNYIIYGYTLDNKRIEYIKYTGNDIQGIAPYNSIYFYWKDREDNNSFYYGNTILNNDELLDKIIISSAGQTVKTYDFNYSYDLHSYLYEIIESGADGTSLNSTIINYQNTDKHDSYTASDLPLNAEFRAGDFNGDGLSDLVAFVYTQAGLARTYNYYSLYLNQGDRTYSLEIANGTLPQNFYPYESLGDMTQNSLKNRGIDAIDLNGDGLEDMLLGRNYGGIGYVYSPYYANQNPTTGAITFIPGQSFTVNAPLSDQKVVMGDYNGDSKVDLFVSYKINGSWIWKLVLFQAQQNGDNIVMIGGDYYVDDGKTDWLEYLNLVSMDYDGDGKSELLAYRNNWSEIQIFSFEVGIGNYPDFIPSNNDAKINEIHRSLEIPNTTLKHFGDFNGDGKTDILSITEYYRTIYYSKGDGFTSVDVGSLIPDYNSGLFYIVNDFNGDGKADVYLSMKNGTHNSNNPYLYYNIFYSNGLSFSPQSYLVNATLGGEIIPTIGEFDGNGSSDIMFQYFVDAAPGQQNPIYFSFTDTRKKLATNIKDGFNKEVNFQYTPMTNSFGTNVYQKHSGATFPLNDLQKPYPLVHKVETQDGIGGLNTTNYFYEGAILERTGKGFLGFTKITKTNSVSDIKTITENELYHQNIAGNYYRTLGFMPIQENHYLMSSNTSLSSSTFTNDISNFKRRVIQQVDHDHIINSITTTDYEYDNGGNVEHMEVSINNGLETSTIDNVYASHGNWGPKNKLMSSAVMSTRQGVSTSYSRNVSYTYNTQGSVILETLDNGLTVNYEYTNGFGNVTKTTTTGGGSTQINRFIYDDKGRYVEENINSLNQHAYTSYDNRWGVPISQIGVDGLTTIYQYDEFGRLVSTTTPDNNSSSTIYLWDIGGGSATNPISADNSLYTTIKTTSGSPEVKTWFDRFGRAIKTEVDGFGDKINQITTYDERGNIKTTTTPFFNGDDPKVTTTTYNDLNQMTKVQNDATSVSYDYTYDTGNNTATVTQTHIDGTSSSTTTDAAGKTINATDNGGLLEFSYYSSGLQKEVKLNGIVTSTMEYDNFGNQTKLTDPNAGETEYLYNALGQLTYQKDAKNNTYDMTYDALGRITTRTENGGSITNYTYYTSGNGINQLEEVNDGIISQHYTYDNLGRLVENKETIETEDYIFSYEYDAFNRVNKTTYPSNFVTRDNYNTHGYPTSITNDQATIRYWKAGAMNANNQYLNYILGNNITTTKTYDDYGLPMSIKASNLVVQDLELVFDPENGNLLQRANNTKNLIENFSYDNSHRLLTAKITDAYASDVLQIATTYQGNGNISSKTDVGNYSYHTNKKNAVIKVADPNNTISTFEQAITYTPFNSVKTILENNQELTFTYGPDQQRRKMELMDNGAITNTTYYLGNYEKIVNANNDVVELNYINGGDGLAAIHVIETPDAQTASAATYYTYTDQLGSITALTDDMGSLVAEQNFDAWGRYRDPQTWQLTTTSGVSASYSWLTRGYTGHEHLKGFEIINMNGRIYDPFTARMLSPDNVVQSPFNTQSYNRYSYVINNPLKYTDPSGESWEDIARGFIDAVGFLSGGRILGESAQYLNDKINGVERTGGYFNQDYLMGKAAPGYTQGGGLGRPTNMSSANNWAARDEYAVESYLYGYAYREASMGKYKITTKNEIIKTRLVKANPENGNDGKKIGVSFSGALIGGLGIELGVVSDVTDNYGLYFTFSGIIGVGGGVNIIFNENIKPTNPNNQFLISDYPGKSGSYNIGLNSPIGGAGVEYGGSLLKSKKGMNAMRISNFGIGERGYREGSGTFDISKPSPRFSIGVSYNYNTTWLWDF